MKREARAAVPLDEFGIIRRFFRPLAGEGALDLNDDAAHLTVPPGFDLVVTADTIASGVHFLPEDPPESVACKALRVNLSDLAAKGAEAIGYVLSIALSQEIDGGWLGAFAQGLRADQDAFGISLLGGDTISVRHAPVISITALGRVPSGDMVRRSGGAPGDALYVTGAIGGATAGLAVATSEPGAWEGLAGLVRERLLRRYRVPEPRIGLAPVLRAHASAAMDVSDGLVGDCDKLAEASGVSAVIEADLVPIEPGLAALAEDDAMLARLITGGDDYEILAAVPSESEEAFRAAAEGAGIAVTRIGRLVAGRGAAKVRRSGKPLALGRRSYAHGAGRGSSHG
jgi:thiamine-monophosphate kinase